MSRAAVALPILLAVAALAFAAAVTFGEQPMDLHVALSDPQSIDASILSLRLSHAALAAIVGAALAASGAALQGIMRNPLADPFVLGVSGGAALGATLAISLGLTGASAFLHLSAPAFFAFLGAIGATALVFLLGRVGGRTSPYSVLLSGTVANAFALAAITAIRTIALPSRMDQIMFWLTGTIGYEERGTLLGTAGIELFAIGGLCVLAGRINVLAMGDDEAASLGVPVELTRLGVLVCASLAVAASVALTGLIGFVGLIVPHLLQLCLGPDQRALIPCSVAGGATLLLLSDLGARALFPILYAQPPVGVITALIGGPFFLFLLHRGQLEVER